MEDAAHMRPKQMLSTQSPDTEREIAGIIARLLLHFYSPGDLSESARTAMAQDWVNDLFEFGSGIVANACREWRNTKTHRPTPADIRLLCVEAQRIRQETRTYRALPSPQDHRVLAARDEDRRAQSARDAEAARLREAMARELGFPSFAAWQGFGLVAGAQRARRGAAGPTAAELGVTAREKTAAGAV